MLYALKLALQVYLTLLVVQVSPTVSVRGTSAIKRDLWSDSKMEEEWDPIDVTSFLVATIHQ